MSGTGNVFWNDRERRLRAGWRVAIGFLAWLVGFAGTAAANSAVPSGVVRGAVTMTLSLAWTAVLVWVLGRFVDRRDVAAFGLRLDTSWWRQFLVGVVLMAAAFLGVLLALRSMGLVTVGDPVAGGLPLLPLLIGGVGVAVASAVNEEFIFRGYLLRNVAEGVRAPGAAPLLALVVGYAFSAVAFALLHSGYGGGWAAFARYLVSALTYSAAFVLTGSLALPIGMHLAHNSLIHILAPSAEGVDGSAVSMTYSVVALGLVLLYTRREPRAERLTWLTEYVARRRHRGGGAAQRGPGAPRRPDPAVPDPHGPRP